MQLERTNHQATHKAMIGETDRKRGLRNPSHHKQKTCIKTWLWLVFNWQHNNAAKAAGERVEIGPVTAGTASQKTRASEVGRPKRPCDTPSEVENGNLPVRLRSGTLASFSFVEERSRLSARRKQ
jgi:hypothetical protein